MSLFFHLKYLVVLLTSQQSTLINLCCFMSCIKYWTSLLCHGILFLPFKYMWENPCIINMFIKRIRITNFVQKSEYCGTAFLHTEFNWMTYCSHFLPHSTCQKVAYFVYKMCFCVTCRAFHTTTWRGLYCIHCFQNGIFCTKSYLDLFSVNQVILEWGCWPSKARMTVNVSMKTWSSFSFVTNNNVHSYSCYVWSLQCGTFTSACLLRQKWTAREWWCPWHTRACCESNLSK